MPRATHPVALEILRDFFAQWHKGRLKPLRFAVLFGLGLAPAYLFTLLFFNAVQVPAPTGPRVAGTAGQAFDHLPWDEGTVWLAAIMMLAAYLGCANLMAKRIRDMGLPGGLAVCSLGIMMMVLLSGGDDIGLLTDAFVFFVFLALLTVPTDRLEQGSGLPRPRD
ncbi:MAG: hypothetical protein AAF511_11615 [Pseudomonadota bacterium]